MCDKPEVDQSAVPELSHSGQPARQWGEMETDLTAQFVASRPRLQSVAYRMLGSLTEAEDAVQETWIRLNRSDAESIENLAGWLTTVLARVCLGMLRSRRARPEQPLEHEEPEPQAAGPDLVERPQKARIRRPAWHYGPAEQHGNRRARALRLQ